MNTSPSVASVTVIVVTLPLGGSSGIPLRSHVILTGGVPVRILQTIVTSYPKIIYAGDPIETITSSGVTVSGGGINGPSSMSGGTPKIKTELNKSGHNSAKKQFKYVQFK